MHQNTDMHWHDTLYPMNRLFTIKICNFMYECGFINKHTCEQNAFLPSIYILVLRVHISWLDLLNTGMLNLSEKGF